MGGTPLAHVVPLPTHALERGWEASLSLIHPCFERQISKMRRCTNVVCCEVKILHLELFPGSSAVSKLSGGERRWLHSAFFLSSFSLSPPPPPPPEQKVQR